MPTHPEDASITSAQIARGVLREQAAALAALAERVNGEFTDAVKLIRSATGRVVVVGMGKSGIIGKKITATLSSTGTPAVFIHPGDAYHGDLGMVVPGDVAILISYSGETDEVIRLLPVLAHFKVPVIALCGTRNSSLARGSEIILDVAVERESCPHNLAPTTSTTATLALGDALAVALMTAKGFRPEDFALRHPGGSLGRRLLTRVRDVMTRQFPSVTLTADLTSVLFAITEGRVGLVLVNDADGRLAGVITDGDLRRALLSHRARTEPATPDFFSLTAQSCMTRAPLTIGEDMLLAGAEELMRTKQVSALIALDAAGRASGIVQIYGPRSA